MARLHGPNERISREALRQMLNFYAHIFDNLQHFDPESFVHHGTPKPLDL